MENASKALIIAGAILLSILIITLGLSVYNNAKNSMGTANMDATEVKAHNSQFQAYEGRQKGSEVKSLMNAIRTNNKQYNDRMVEIAFSTTTNKETLKGIDLSKDNTDPNDYGVIADVKSTTTYYVSFTEGENGCINGAEIHVYSDADLN